jgi:hypothetical protein
VNRALLMLEVLRDGRPHTRREIFDHAGFLLTNNAASELRAMGYDVQQSRERVDGVNVYSYSLHGSLEKPDCVERDPGGQPLSVMDGVTDASGSSSELSSLPTPALSASPPGHGLNDPDSGRAGAESEPDSLPEGTALSDERTETVVGVPSESEWTCRCGSTEYRHVTDDIFRCNGCNARADIFSRQLPLEGVA